MGQMAIAQSQRRKATGPNLLRHASPIDVTKDPGPLGWLTVIFSCKLYLDKEMVPKDGDNKK